MKKIAVLLLFAMLLSTTAIGCNDNEGSAEPEPNNEEISFNGSDDERDEVGDMDEDMTEEEAEEQAEDGGLTDEEFQEWLDEEFGEDDELTDEEQEDDSDDSQTIPSEQPSGDGDYVVVDYGETGVNLRSGPGTKYDTVGSVQEGDQLEVVSYLNYWIEIELGDGGKAYVAGWLTDADLPFPDEDNRQDERK